MATRAPVGQSTVNMLRVPCKWIHCLGQARICIAQRLAVCCDTRGRKLGGWLRNPKRPKGLEAPSFTSWEPIRTPRPILHSHPAWSSWGISPAAAGTWGMDGSPVVAPACIVGPDGIWAWLYSDCVCGNQLPTRATAQPVRPSAPWLIVLCADGGACYGLCGTGSITRWNIGMARPSTPGMVAPSPAPSGQSLARGLHGAVADCEVWGALYCVCNWVRHGRTQRTGCWCRLRTPIAGSNARRRNRPVGAITHGRSFWQ